MILEGGGGVNVDTPAKTAIPNLASGQWQHRLKPARRTVSRTESGVCSAAFRPVQAKSRMTGVENVSRIVAGGAGGGREETCKGLPSSVRVCTAGRLGPPDERPGARLASGGPALRLRSGRGRYAVPARPCSRFFATRSREQPFLMRRQADRRLSPHKRNMRRFPG